MFPPRRRNRTDLTATGPPLNRIAGHFNLQIAPGAAFHSRSRPSGGRLGRGAKFTDRNQT